MTIKGKYKIQDIFDRGSPHEKAHWVTNGFSSLIRKHMDELLKAGKTWQDIDRMCGVTQGNSSRFYHKKRGNQAPFETLLQFMYGLDISIFEFIASTNPTRFKEIQAIRRFKPAQIKVLSNLSAKEIDKTIDIISAAFPHVKSE